MLKNYVKIIMYNYYVKLYYVKLLNYANFIIQKAGSTGYATNLVSVFFFFCVNPVGAETQFIALVQRSHMAP